MGREVRRVIPNWQHPMVDSSTYDSKGGYGGHNLCMIRISSQRLMIGYSPMQSGSVVSILIVLSMRDQRGIAVTTGSGTVALLTEHTTAPNGRQKKRHGSKSMKQ